MEDDARRNSLPLALEAGSRLASDHSSPRNFTEVTGCLNFVGSVSYSLMCMCFARIFLLTPHHVPAASGHQRDRPAQYLVECKMIKVSLDEIITKDYRFDVFLK